MLDLFEQLFDALVKIHKSAIANDPVCIDDEGRRVRPNAVAFGDRSLSGGAEIPASMTVDDS